VLRDNAVLQTLTAASSAAALEGRIRPPPHDFIPAEERN
jgi:hypothetical protein